MAKQRASQTKAKRAGRRAKACMVLFALLMLCTLISSACAAPAAQQATISSLEATKSPSPVPLPTPTPAPTPSDGKVRLDPVDLLNLLFEKRSDPNQSKENTFDVSCEEIAAILRDRGENGFSNLLIENSDAYVSMQVNLRTLYYQNQYETPQGQTDYAAIILNNYRLAYCLIFEKQDEWLLVNYFPCGEADDSQSMLDTQTAEDSLYGKQTWLIIPGLVGSGSAMKTANCTWYNLNTHTLELNYIPSMFRCQGNTPLQYKMEGSAEISANPEGRLVFTVRYAYIFGNEAYFSDGKRADMASLTRTETQTYNWEPGEPFLPQSYGRFEGSPEHEFSVRDAFLICEKELYAMRRKGSAAEKAWIEALDIEYDHEYNNRILVGALGAKSMPVARYAGNAPAPRLDFLDTSPTFTVQPGTEFILDFDLYDPPYKLTRYDPFTKESAAVPTTNDHFFAEQQEATFLYTLERITYGGLNSYDFMIVTSAGAPQPAIPGDLADDEDRFFAEETVKNALSEKDAVSLGSEHIEKIIGYAIKDKAFNVSSVLRKGVGAIPDEWDMRYSLYDIPQLQFNLRCVAQTGNITFFVCTYKDQVSGGPAALSLDAPPAGTEDMDMKELALYYYELLPVDDQGELKRVEYKRDIKNEDGSITAQIYVRFKSDNVFAIDFDKEVKRPVWICMYYK